MKMKTGKAGRIFMKPQTIPIFVGRKNSLLLVDCGRRLEWESSWPGSDSTGQTRIQNKNAYNLGGKLGLECSSAEWESVKLEEPNMKSLIKKTVTKNRRLILSLVRNNMDVDKRIFFLTPPLHRPSRSTGPKWKKKWKLKNNPIAFVRSFSGVVVVTVSQRHSSERAPNAMDPRDLGRVMEWFDWLITFILS